MSKADNTRDRLLEAARAAFWQRGYANVGLRDIAGAAGADVALISRYFGGKRGLFAATLDGAFHWPDLLAADDPAAVVVAKYTNPDLSAAHVSVIRMIAANIADPEVGDLVRAAQKLQFHDPMLAKLGGPDKAPQLALFISVMVGADLTREVIGLPGLADATVYARQLRHLLDAALAFPG